MRTPLPALTILSATLLAACSGAGEQSSDAAGEGIESLSSDELLSVEEPAPGSPGRDEAQPSASETASAAPPAQSGSNPPGTRPPDPKRSKLIKADR